MNIYVVQGEHPHDPFYPLYLHVTTEKANERAAEITRDFVKDFLATHYEDAPMPDVTAANWRSVVELYGYDSAISDANLQDDGFGGWFVALTQQELTA